MPTIGRNETCHCGSGKKYKKCCIDKVERKFIKKASPVSPFFSFLEDDHLDRDSNRVVELLNEGRIDEAEKAARKLLEDYPEVNDGFERLGLVYEKQGDKVKAIEMYQKALDFTLLKENIDNYEEGFREHYRETILKLKNQI